MSKNRMFAENKMQNRVLVFAAHPDDEVFGCGGTIAYHRSVGDPVGVCYLSEGVSSRYDLDKFNDPSSWRQDLIDRENMARQAASILDFEIIDFLRLPNLRAEDLPLLDIVKQVMPILESYQPTTVYVHFPGDLNTDHTVTFNAVYTALRPSTWNQVKQILCYEVVSSTEWASNILPPRFNPDTYIDIEEFFELKMKSISAYEFEMRPAPHPRSPELISALATLRGAEVGINMAEALSSVRHIINSER